jgi:hypothetical protein
MAAHVPALARTTTNATKSAASIVDRVQLVGIVDNCAAQLEIVYILYDVNVSPYFEQTCEQQAGPRHAWRDLVTVTPSCGGVLNAIG